MWWSAGDPNNVLQFYSGNRLLERFKTADIINLINASPNKKAYYGNPNNGQNKGEPYAFINFYADPSNPNLEFTKIVLSNVATGTGFESDNHTIASTYADISGKAINPLPSFNTGTNPGSNDMLGINGANVPISGGSTIGGSGAATVPITNGGTLSDTRLLSAKTQVPTAVNAEIAENGRGRQNGVAGARR
jgi:hypothetical protein